jgi:hypothetical protein
MLASDQLKKSKAPVLQLSRKPGSSGDKPSGAMALSATRDAKIWFVLLKGQRYGPCTFTALVHVAEIGLVDAETGVWCLGWAEWRIARDVPGLFEQESDDLDEDIEARGGRGGERGPQPRQGGGKESRDRGATSCSPRGPETSAPASVQTSKSWWEGAPRHPLYPRCYRDRVWRRVGRDFARHHSRGINAARCRPIETGRGHAGQNLDDRFH